jgi:hypothetical protein
VPSAVTYLGAGNDWAGMHSDALAVIRGPLVIGDIAVIAQGCERSIVTKTCVVFEMPDGNIRRASE